MATRSLKQTHPETPAAKSGSTSIAPGADPSSDRVPTEEEELLARLRDAGARGLAPLREAPSVHGAVHGADGATPPPDGASGRGAPHP